MFFMDVVVYFPVLASLNLTAVLLSVMLLAKALAWGKACALIFDSGIALRVVLAAYIHTWFGPRPNRSHADWIPGAVAAGSGLSIVAM